MAHALPLLEPEFKVGEKGLITVGGVVDCLIQESKSRGFNPKNAKVIVNAGDKGSLDKILENLRAKGIPVVEGKLRFNKGYSPRPTDTRVIKYDSLRDEINVFKEDGFPDYRELGSSSEWQGP